MANQKWNWLLKVKNIIKRYRKGVAFPGFIRFDGGELDIWEKDLNSIYEKACVLIDGHSSPEESHTTVHSANRMGHLATAIF